MHVRVFVEVLCKFPSIQTKNMLEIWQTFKHDMMSQEFCSVHIVSYKQSRSSLYSIHILFVLWIYLSISISRSHFKLCRDFSVDNCKSNNPTAYYVSHVYITVLKLKLFNITLQDMSDHQCENLLTHEVTEANISIKWLVSTAHATPKKAPYGSMNSKFRFLLIHFQCCNCNIL